MEYQGIYNWLKAKALHLMFLGQSFPQLCNSMALGVVAELSDSCHGYSHVSIAGFTACMNHQ